MKGGVVDGKPLSMKDLSALADLPSRDVLLAQIAGLLASPLRTMAGLLKAVPQNFAYGLSALIESKGGVAPAEDKVEEVAETPAGVEEAAPAASDDDATPVAEVAVEEEAPAAEPEAEVPVEEAPAAEPEAESKVEDEVPVAEPDAETPVEDAAPEAVSDAPEAPTEDAAVEPAE